MAAGDVDLATPFGAMKIGDGKTMYLGGSHWVSIMCEIQEFRSFLEHQADNIERCAFENYALIKETGDNSSLLHGTGPHATKEELLSYLPSRAICDKLIARFFTAIWQALPIIHETTFRKEVSLVQPPCAKYHLTFLSISSIGIIRKKPDFRGLDYYSQSCVLLKFPMRSGSSCPL